MRKVVNQGWYVVAGLFLVLTISSGFGFYNLSVYMNVLAAEKGFSISELSLAVSLFFVVGGVTGIWVARLLERFDVRWVMLAGAALGGAALGLTGMVDSLAGLYLLYAAFGIGNSGVSVVTSTTLVTRWFPGRERAMALSIASTGLSMGGVLLTPLSARLLNEFGAGASMPWFGAAFYFAIAPVVLLLIRDRALESGAATTTPPAGWSYASAVRSRYFLAITAAFVLCMTAQVGGISHLYNRVEGVAGYRVAAAAVQALTVMSIVCRLLGGVLVRWVRLRTFAFGNLLGQALGLALVAVADTPLLALLGAGVFGATVGNLLMLHPLLLAESFGVRAYARIFSVSNAFTVIGVAGGPVLLGVLYDSADYRAAYLVAASASLLALWLVAAAGRDPERDPEVAAAGTGSSA